MKNRRCRVSMRDRRLRVSMRDRRLRVSVRDRRFRVSVRDRRFRVSVRDRRFRVSVRDRRATRRGVTLLELLVAMTLFTLLGTGVFYSLRTGIRSLERSREQVSTARRAAGAERALERMLAGLMPVNAEYIAPASSAPMAMPFLQGDPQLLRFVTSYSLEEGLRGSPRIVEMSVLPREDRAGVRLVVNELPYFGPRSAGTLIAGMGPDPLDGRVGPMFREFAAGPRTFVLADRLPRCQFAYLDRAVPPEPDPWLPRWRQSYYPRAIRIDMGTRAVTGQVYVSMLH